MASAYFRAAAPAGGGRLDIHAGGVDIRFPHHENELAAAEAHAAGAAAAPATTACVVCAAPPSSEAGGGGGAAAATAAGSDGRPPWVRHWWHTGLLVNKANEKLSKSAGDAGTIRGWLAAGGGAAGGGGGAARRPPPPV